MVFYDIRIYTCIFIYEIHTSVFTDEMYLYFHIKDIDILYENISI